MSKDTINFQYQLNGKDIVSFINTVDQITNAIVLSYPVPESAYSQLEENSKEFNARIKVTTNELSEELLTQCYQKLSMLLGLINNEDHPTLKALLSENLAKVIDYCNSHNINHNSLGVKPIGLNKNGEDAKFTMLQRLRGYDEDTAKNNQIAKEMCKELKPNRPMDRQTSDKWASLLEGIADNKSRDNYTENLNRLELDACNRLTARQAEEKLRQQRIMAMSKARAGVELDALDRKTKLMELASLYLLQQCKDKRSGDMYNAN